MDLVDPGALVGQIPLDFHADYRQSDSLQGEQLSLPTRDDVVAAVTATMALPHDVIDQAMTALAAGRHVLLYGPPGTGKTTLAAALAAAYGCEAIAHTASADWTPFETAGGLQLTLRDGVEHLEPRAGVITESVVRCLNHIAAEKAGDPTPHKGAWLILDELNRANVDAAFGPYFNVLDSAHHRVQLPFMDDPRKVLSVPRRFRVIGTMNTYDKNFLFRLSYALTRRFALVEVGVPDNADATARQIERDGIAKATSLTLASAGIVKTPEAIVAEYSIVLDLLYEKLATKIRGGGDEASLSRGIAFAQLSSTLAQCALAFELEYGEAGTDADRRLDALDRALLSSIVPQLEGLPNSRLRAFADWWAGEPELKKLSRSVRATRALISGLDLFVADAE